MIISPEPIIEEPTIIDNFSKCLKDYIPIRIVNIRRMNFVTFGIYSGPSMNSQIVIEAQQLVINARYLGALDTFLS